MRDHQKTPRVLQSTVLEGKHPQSGFTLLNFEREEMKERAERREKRIKEEKQDRIWKL